MRFDAYHPMISALYFLFLLTFVTVIEHPVYLGISFLTGLIYATKLKGKSAFLFGLLLLPGIGLYAYYYSRYNHFGMTNLRETAIGNMITLESILYGGLRGMKAASLLLWLLCVHEIFTTDKIVYLLGRISPKLSLYFAILLRTAPKTVTTAHRIQSGQEAMGRGIRQGNIFRRVQNLLRVGSILLTFMTESFVETADSMRSRGYGLKGRTAFSLYRFDNRDRAVVVTLFLGTALLGSAYLLDQMAALYDPKIILNPITGVSVLFYIIYALLALLPMFLQCFGEWSFEKNHKRLPERG